MPSYNKAVVLLNMGGPNSLDEVGTFLKNMFADPCILDVKNGMFRSMLGSMIVNARVEKSKAMYAKIGGSSPLTSITFSLTQKLQARDPNTFYTYAMRYVPPYAPAVLQEIKQHGIQEIVLFSMYPQYSSTTTYSSFQDIADSLRSMDYTPSIRTISRYGAHPLFIEAVAQSIQETLGDLNPKDCVLLISAHSIPLSRVKKGDPYERECQEGLRLLRQRLESCAIAFHDIILCYQSKVGPTKWLTPTTDSVIKEVAPRNIIIYPISFTIDNSETKYELCMQYAELAASLGVKEYRVCPCLNDSNSFLNLIESLSNEAKEQE